MTADNIRHLGMRQRPEPFETFSPTEWQGKIPPPIEWMVQNTIPRRTVCMFSGDSGLGKSLLLMQLQTCASIGAPWLGFETAHVRTFGVYCEDNKIVLQNRMRAVCSYYGIEEGDLENATMASRTDKESVLMRFNQKTNTGSATSLYEQIRHIVVENGVQLLILDTLANFFSGNENIREQVTSFVGLLQALADEMDGAVVISAHPSVAALASGTGFSGSTAWKARVRSHVYLKRPKKFDIEDEESDFDARILQNMKANYGRGGGISKLRYIDGVFALDGDQRVPTSTAISKIQAENSIMYGVRYCIGRGELVASDPGHVRALWNVCGGAVPSMKGFHVDDLIAAQQRLMDNGKLTVVEVTYADGFLWCIRPPEGRYNNERLPEPVAAPAPAPTPISRPVARLPYPPDLDEPSDDPSPSGFPGV